MPEKNEARRLRIGDLPVEERPIQRLERYGESALSTLELLAIVIGTGHADDSVLEIAYHLLTSFEGMSGIAQANLHELRGIRVIGRLLDIQLLDHLVIGRDRYVSLKERGLGFEG